MNVAIIGSGYVGLTTAAILAAAGHEVTCVDIDNEKIKTINAGKAHFYEPGLDDLVRSGVESGRLKATNDYSEAIPSAEIAMICVGTPSLADGAVNLSYIITAASNLAAYASQGLVVVTKSTVPVGTGKKVSETIKGKTEVDFHVLSCPEFLSEGSAVYDSLFTDRFIVGGEDEAAIDKLVSLFADIDKLADGLDTSSLNEFGRLYRAKIQSHEKIDFESKVQRMNLESAELVKITANAFLATKISFANSVARICDQCDADVNQVMDGIGSDKRIGRDFLYAGLGWGGGCFPKDVSGLLNFSKQVGFDFKILEEVYDLNFSQIDYAIELIQEILGGFIHDKHIAIWGLSFKPGTSDTRLSPAIGLLKKLIKSGASVSAFDPKANEDAKKDLTPELKTGKLILKDSAVACVENTDILVLATEWPEFIKFDYESIKSKFKGKPTIIDTRNRLNSKELIAQGYTYKGLGIN